MSASILFLVTGCGGSESGPAAVLSPTASIVSTTVPERAPGSAGDIEQACAELKFVQDLSDQTAAATNEILQRVATDPEGTSEAEIIAAFATLATEIEASLPETLAAYDRAAAVAPSGMQDAARDAGIASLRIDNFTNPNCGFQFSNS